MLNVAVKLNPKIWDGFGKLTAGKNVERMPIRKGFGEGLLAIWEFVIVNPLGENI